MDDLKRVSNKKKTAELLAAKYTKNKRMMETACVTLYTALLCASCYKICNMFFLKNIWVFLCASVLSMVLADFFSGLLHWFADTWGSLDTPLIGNSFIRSFREHHIEPTAICRHDIVETNGDNCMVTMPIIFLTAVVNLKPDSVYHLFVHNFLVLLCIWVSLTNQIHKWSHTYRPSKIVSLMQQYGLVLSKRDHAIHHRNPFDKYYCITNGWLNPWLASFNFWKRFEEMITDVTGVEPREDDMLWTGVTANLQ